MATINFISSRNNSNIVTWGWGTKLEFRTDRKVSATLALHSLVASVDNMGVGVTRGNPFTNLS